MGNENSQNWKRKKNEWTSETGRETTIKMSQQNQCGGAHIVHTQRDIYRREQGCKDIKSTRYEWLKTKRIESRVCVCVYYTNILHTQASTEHKIKYISNIPDGIWWLRSPLAFCVWTSSRCRGYSNVSCGTVLPFASSSVKFPETGAKMTYEKNKTGEFRLGKINEIENNL